MFKELTPLQKMLAATLIFLIAICLWKLIPARDIYISDIKNINIIHIDWMTLQRDASVDGNGLIMGEKYYPKGIGIHANSEIQVQVPPDYNYFVADVGIDDEIKDESPASVIFKVMGDGVILYESPVIRAYMPPYRIQVNVEGVDTLSLIVADAGDGNNSDHSDWGKARFVQR